MRGHRSRAPEPSRIVDTRLEGQGRDRADSRDRHQALTDRIFSDQHLGLVIQLQIGAIQRQPRIQ